jgi:hypothetical protein
MFALALKKKFVPSGDSIPLRSQTQMGQDVDGVQRIRLSSLVQKCHPERQRRI